MVSHMILHILHSKQKNFNGVLSLAISVNGSWQSALSGHPLAFLNDAPCAMCTKPCP